MDKYIGFDIDSKKTVACVVQKGKRDKCTRLGTDIEQMQKSLQRQRRPGGNLHLTFEIGGQGVRFTFVGGFFARIIAPVSSRIVSPRCHSRESGNPAPLERPARPYKPDSLPSYLQI